MNQSELGRRLDLSQAYISKIESGGVNFDKLPLSTVEKLAQVLEFRLEDWSTILEGALPRNRRDEPTSLPSLSARSRALSAGSKYRNVPRWEIEVPDVLQEAADQYGHLPMYKGIGERRWQHFMLSVSRKVTPQDVEGWLREFSDLKRMGYDPEEPE